MSNAPERLLTPSQTIGPFSHEAWRWAIDATAVVTAGAPTVRIAGAVYDGDGAAINDAVIEAWLPDAAELEAGHALPAFRRVPSDDLGHFSLTVPQAGSATASSGEPVMYVTVFARGMVRHQFTAVFLEDDPGLERSEMLLQVPQARRATLVAKKEAPGQYRWDIWLQTEKETVFFDYL